MTTLFLATLSGILLFLSFPRFDLWPLAWVALVPLLTAISPLPRSSPSKHPWRQAFCCGWWTGTIYFLGCIYWVTHSMTRYGDLPLPVSFFLMLLLVIYLGVFIGFFALSTRAVQAFSPGLQIVAVPALWVALEWIRGHLLTGLPWALMGYSQFRFVPLIQIADTTGVYGVSYLVVMANVLMAQLIRAWPARGSRWSSSLRPLGVPILLTAGLTTACLLYGFLKLAPSPPADRILQVALIQGNIEQDQKWDPVRRQETLKIYQSLTAQAHALARTQNARRPALDLVVWPETATPFYFEREPQYREVLMELTRTHGVPLLFGSPAVEWEADHPGTTASLFNSAYLIQPPGSITARYDKMHLVPFGEYVPFPRMLSFVHKLVEGIGDFKPGQDFTVMQIPQARLSVVICFEVIFPGLVRQFVKEGAELMVTLTNDAWFGRTSAPYQHFSMVVFRAVENRVPFLRAANTGITGQIDASGRVIEQTGLFMRTGLLQTVRLSKNPTFYTHYGDVFALLCVIIAPVLILAAYRKKPKPGETQNAAGLSRKTGRNP